LGAVCPQRAAPRDEYVPIKTEMGAFAAKENSDSGQSLDALVALSALPLYGGAPINDTGCSHHMTGDSTLLHDYKDLFSGNGMKYHGAESTAVLGIGALVLRCPSHSDLYIPDVYLTDTTMLNNLQVQKQFKANYTETDDGMSGMLLQGKKPLLATYAAGNILVDHGTLLSPQQLAASVTALLPQLQRTSMASAAPKAHAA
jgi:hypothetical protein